MLTVRKIESQELIKFIDLLTAFHREAVTVPMNNPKWDGFDAIDFIESIAGTIAAGPGVFYGAFDAAGIPHGLLYGLIIDEPFFGCKTAMESIWYVDKANRDSSGLDLLFMFEHEAKAAGARIMTCGHFPYINGEKMGRMYQRLGFRHFQEQYGKEL